MPNYEPKSNNKGSE
jgi:transcription elongation factor Elf1